MPKALKRHRDAGGYGWSRVYGPDNRTVSDKYKENYDLIKWESKLGPPDKKNPFFRLGGSADVWVFGPERFKDD